MLNVSLCVQYRGNLSSGVSSNSETNSLELIENTEKMFPDRYRYRVNQINYYIEVVITIKLHRYSAIFLYNTINNNREFICDIVNCLNSFLAIIL